MNLFIIMLISVFASIMIADILPFVREIKYRMKRESLKPFDCNFCLSGWFALGLSIIFYSNWYNLLIALFVTPFLTALVYYFWQRIQKDLLRLKNK